MPKVGNIQLGDFPLLLAPMEDVSDPPFRYLCRQKGADLVFTEFISSEGLIRDAAKSVKKLDMLKDERPVGIQIFGSDLDSMKEAVAIATEAKPDIIDINYGCPVKNVVCKGAGAAILRDVPKMEKLTAEIVKSTHLPVTVKTRLGWDKDTMYIEEVAERLQDVGIQAISIHGRTRAQMYKGEADWDMIGKVKQNPRLNIPVFGNGDVDSPEKALQMKEQAGVDGVMIGRAAIGYPWIFDEIKYYMRHNTHAPVPAITERINVCLAHLDKAIAWKGKKRAIIEMRKFYHQYFKGVRNFKPFRKELVETETYEEVESIFDRIKTYYAPAEAGLEKKL